MAAAQAEKRNLSQISTSSSMSDDLELSPSQFDQLIGSIQSVKSEPVTKQYAFDNQLSAIENKLTKLDIIEQSIDQLKSKQVEQTSFNESI